ncbi:MAG: helicase C-terminal domain-containing protein, partial [Nitrospirota bacterium]
MNELTAAFEILKKTLPGYEARPQQTRMAEEVFACLKGNKNLLVEAGTGVGKSFAYLIPAILSNRKTVVSTASLALQDQLVNKDLIFLQNALPQRFSFALLKGKNNYLCLKREREFADLGESHKKFRQWAATTGTGDKDELSYIPDFWLRVSGDSQDCNSRLCPYYRDCFYYRHYRSLPKKDILVVNHHLLLYDLVSELNLLPFHEHLIIDEAHQLEDVISYVLGNSLNYSQMLWLLYRLRALKIAVDHLFEPIEQFFKRKLLSSQAVSPIPDSLIDDLIRLKELLGIEVVAGRLQKHGESATDDELADKIKTTVAYLNTLNATFEDFISQKDEDRVYYVTGVKNAIELKSSLVESRSAFKSLIQNYERVIMTSATLTAGGDFGFLRQRLGIEDFKEMVVGSPFNYRKQSLLYLDKELPLPDKDNADAFYTRSLKVIEDLINASRGRALVLFTSYKHLHFAAEHISVDYPFRAQGEMPPAKLIQWFKKTPHSILLATATFWQGIDIKGEKLSLVVIVKMPFGSPGDPVYDERCKRLAGRWFSDLALPSAILMVRQGFGRLIRSSDDYGVVAILDPRLVVSSYGRIVVSSLPEAPIVHTIKDVQNFYES